MQDQGIDVKQKVIKIFKDKFGFELRIQDEQKLLTAIRSRYALPEEQTYDIFFHLLDWLDDGAFLIAAILIPEAFTNSDLEDGIDQFLIHAPNHIAAAAKLSGWPVADIFGVGALEDFND